MIDQLTRALNGRQWPDYVHGQLGPLIGDAVAPFLSPVVGAEIAEPTGEPLPVGVSKAGGLPHVDGSFAWPVETGTREPLGLVCQVNLDEARHTEQLRGMLYLFSIFDSDRAYGYEIDETTAKLLHVPQPGPLAVAARPEGLADDGLFEERRLHVSWSMLAGEADEDGARSKRFDYEVEKALDEEVSALGGVPCDEIRLLGMPHPFREETQEIVDELSEPRLLLYVNGYAVQRHAFGEGDFQVVLEKAALDAGRLGDAEVMFEPGT